MNSAFSRTILKYHEKITGRRILECLEELNRSQWLSLDELESLQRTKLLKLVEYANQYIPYYRRIFSNVGFHPQDLNHDPTCFSKIPILTKAIIRENWDDLQTTEPERRQRLSKLSTSGSTGQPLVFMQDPDFRDNVTADIQRHMGWAGWKLGDLQAVIWGTSFNRNIQQRVRSQFIDWVWNRFQINAFRMTEVNMIAFANQVKQKKPNILFGYATSINHFAHFIRQRDINGITFKGIFSSAEVLVPSVRQFIEDTFMCKVFNRYGTLDLGGIACECGAHTGLHVSVENNYVEILHDGTLVGPGKVGEIIVTNLNNRGMPFIRYSIGDAGEWYTGEKCPCGRASPMLKMIEGRLVDTFYIRDGRSVWSGFTGSGFRCMAHPAIKQFQIVQKELEKIVVRLVPDGELPQNVLNEISLAIRAMFGDNVVVEFEFMEKIPPLPSGKHTYAISEINKSSDRP